MENKVWLFFMQYISTGYRVIPMSENQIVNQNTCMLLYVPHCNFDIKKALDITITMIDMFTFLPQIQYTEQQEDVCLKAWWSFWHSLMFVIFYGQFRLNCYSYFMMICYVELYICLVKLFSFQFGTLFYLGIKWHEPMNIVNIRNVWELRVHFNLEFKEIHPPYKNYF